MLPGHADSNEHFRIYPKQLMTTITKLLKFCCLSYDVLTVQLLSYCRLLS